MQGAPIVGGNGFSICLFKQIHADSVNQNMRDTLRPPVGKHTFGSATQPQRDAYKQAREWMDRGLAGIRAGVGSDEIAALLPKAEEFGFESEMAAFGLQFAHGLGLGLHERPIISRLNSMKEPVEIQAGMVFALETYCPASDGFSAARIEEEVVVTEDGPRVITLFPAQDLVVTNPY